MDTQIDGEIISPPVQQYGYILAYRPKGTPVWNISGVLYRSPEDAHNSFAWLQPESFLIIRIPFAALLEIDKGK
jgi:hypothetical protein